MKMFVFFFRVCSLFSFALLFLCINDDTDSVERNLLMVEPICQAFMRRNTAEVYCSVSAMTPRCSPTAVFLVRQAYGATQSEFDNCKRPFT